MFKTVPGFERYSVDENGIVVNNVTGRILKQYLAVSRNSGYKYVYLYNKKGRKVFAVHRLVATAFISNPHILPQVNHKDENSTNNHVFNLEWCDSKYNNNYGTKPERQKAMASGSSNPFFGKKHSMKTRKRLSELKRGKPSTNRKKVIVDGIVQFDSLTSCSKYLGISLTQVFNIINHKRKSTHRIDYYGEDS